MSDPNAVAFTVQGFGVTAAQRDAALAVTVGVFSTSEVADALQRAGVDDLPGQNYTVGRAVDRILQPERKAKRIRVVKGRRGIWERIA